jgi:hypothetical protein
MPGIIEYVNQFPVWLGVLYLLVESLKAWLPYKKFKNRAKEVTRNNATDAVFEMYELTKKDTETDKVEIRELTRLLKRANLEITILERKIGALMRAMDGILIENPNAHETYIHAMHQYKKEMLEITDGLEGDKDFE